MNNNGTLRALRIIELLAGRFFDGLSNKDIAAALKTSAANASRDLAQLEKIGWTKKMETGRWALTVKPLAIMRAYEVQFNSLQSRMSEAERNITAASTRYGA